MVKDYPPGHMEKMFKLYCKFRRLFPRAEVWVTVPDYCDDYHPGNLWLDEKTTNIERTLQNIITAVEKYPQANWLIPVQGWNHQPQSIAYSIQLLKIKGLMEYNYYALANLCVEARLDIITATAKIARSLLPDKKLHIFGLKLKAVSLIRPYINSFDSLAWTRPVDGKTRVCVDGRWLRRSSRNAEDRRRFFDAWMTRLNYYLRQSLISEIIKNE
jgi:hypothetical protein